jgi:hypothetical protein
MSSEETVRQVLAVFRDVDAQCTGCVPLADLQAKLTSCFSAPAVAEDSDVQGRRPVIDTWLQDVTASGSAPVSATDFVMSLVPRANAAMVASYIDTYYKEAESNQRAKARASSTSSVPAVQQQQ